MRQDDGFCLTLMLCAAAAEDGSMARAVYFASKVRRPDHLRTWGGQGAPGQAAGPDPRRREAAAAAPVAGGRGPRRRAGANKGGGWIRRPADGGGQTSPTTCPPYPSRRGLVGRIKMEMEIEIKIKIEMDNLHS